MSLERQNYIPEAGMITGDYEYLKGIIAKHICPLHPRDELTVAWCKDAGWLIRCGGGHYPDELQYVVGYVAAYKRGEDLPLPIANAIERKLGIRKEEKMPGLMDIPEPEKGLQALAIYEASTGQVANRDARELAIAYAQEVGVLPQRGHICLYFGKPWITIEGWYYLLRQEFPNALLTTRPLENEERAKLKVDEKTHAWEAKVYDEDKGKLLSVGFGYANPDEPLAQNSPIEKRYPWRLAEKRAEEDAIRKVVGL